MTGTARATEPPFPLDARFPSRFEQWFLPCKNWISNRLYPVPLPIFCGAVSGIMAKHWFAPFDIVVQFRSLIFGQCQLEGSEILRFAEALVVALFSSYITTAAIRFCLRRFVFGYKGYLYEEPRKPSFLTKMWAICRRVLVSITSPGLESCNGLLPKLPVPGLKETVERYLESVEPLLTQTDFENVRKTADEFLKCEGPVLQRYVKFYALTVNNYVTPLWQKYAYLANRESVLITSSLGHVDSFELLPANQALRAARVAYVETLGSLASWRQQIAPLADGLVYAGHYKYCYSTTRIPGEEVDSVKAFLPSRHIVVLCKGRFYKVDMFDEYGRIYSLEKIYQIFIELVRRKGAANRHEPSAMIAALTADRRDTWCTNRKRFFIDVTTNKRALEIIESSILAITLEDEEYHYDPERPERLDAFMKLSLTGSGSNRWADKVYNFLITKNGRAGGTTEHSTADGFEFGYGFENYFFTETKFLSHLIDERDVKNIPNWEPPKDVRLAEELEIEVDNEMAAEIKRCHEEYQQRCDNTVIAALPFDGFGKEFIKTKAKCSPDAFVQMTIQLAFYKIHNKFVLTYEPASARFYQNSRTEALRTVSKDSCAFVKAMCSEVSTNEERIRYLHAASKTHTKKTRDAMSGKGIDRHLFVLYLMSRGKKMSSPFLDHYVAQGWTLCTSQAPTVTNLLDEDSDPRVSWMGGCFAPVDKNGYGVCYRFAGNHRICVNISSFKSSNLNADADKFRQTLKDCLQEMASMFMENPS